MLKSQPKHTEKKNINRRREQQKHANDDALRIIIIIVIIIVFVLLLQTNCHTVTKTQCIQTDRQLVFCFIIITKAYRCSIAATVYSQNKHDRAYY